MGWMGKRGREGRHPLCLHVFLRGKRKRFEKTFHINTKPF
jgi:hypothetical protein